MENKEVEATETIYGIICVRKGQHEGKDIWFATVGNQCVSRGTYGTKKEVLEDLEHFDMSTVCKIVAGAFERAISISKPKE
jgi:hypothetical protein